MPVSLGTLNSSSAMICLPGLHSIYCPSGSTRNPSNTSQASSVGPLRQTQFPTSSTAHTGAATKAFVLSLTPVWAPSSKSALSESPCANLPVCPCTQPRPTCLTNLSALTGIGREGGSVRAEGDTPQHHRVPLNPRHQQGSSSWGLATPALFLVVSF